MKASELKDRISQVVTEQDDDKDDDVEAYEIIKELIETGWSGDNEKQGKAVQLLRGLAFSDAPSSNKFMKTLDGYTSKLDPEDFKKGSD